MKKSELITMGTITSIGFILIIISIIAAFL